MKRNILVGCAIFLSAIGIGVGIGSAIWNTADDNDNSDTTVGGVLLIHHRYHCYTSDCNFLMLNNRKSFRLVTVLYKLYIIII